MRLSKLLKIRWEKFCKTCPHCTIWNESWYQPRAASCSVLGRVIHEYSIGHFSKKVNSPQERFHPHADFKVPNECPYFLDMMMVQERLKEKSEHAE